MADMTSIHRHQAYLCNIHYTSSLLCNSAAAVAAAAAENSPVSKKLRSFRIADILTPSYRHYSATSDVTRGDVTRQDCVTSTRETMTSYTDNEDANEQKYVEVDDVMTSQREVMTSPGVNALRRMIQMTYDACDDDDDDDIRRHKPRHHYQHHRQG